MKSAKAAMTPELEHPEFVTWEEIKDASLTGNFEVSVDGKLMHSKKTKNEGFLHDNPANMESIVTTINNKTSGA